MNKKAFLRQIAFLIICLFGFSVVLTAKRKEKSALDFITTGKEINMKELFQDKFFYDKAKITLSYERRNVTITLKRVTDQCRISSNLIRRDIKENAIHYEISISCTKTIPLRKTETVILPLTLFLSENPQRRHVHLVTENVYFEAFNAKK